MKKTILIFLLINANLSFSQTDTVSLEDFKNIHPGDTLKIDYINQRERNVTGDKILIIGNKNSFSVLQFIRFHEKLFIDGIELTDDKSKMKFIIEWGKYEQNIMSKEELNNFLKYVQKTINSGGNGLPIAGSGSSISIKSNTTALELELPETIDLRIK